MSALVLACALGWVQPGMAATANDPGLTRQWGLTVIGAPTAWDAGTGAGSTIAIVDTGVDVGHPDLASKVVAQATCVGANGDPARCRAGPGLGQDDNGHGTHVAGIAAAITNNGTGVAATAPGATILAVRALVDEGNDPGNSATGDVDDIVAGIRWAVANKAAVVNLSLGPDIALAKVLGTGMEQAIQEAWRAGVICVLAAGNDALPISSLSGVNALVVAATTRQDVEASYSTGVAGSKWGLAAPGGAGGSTKENDIFSTYLPGSYTYLAGTSMAAPFVAGAAATLRSLGLTPQQTVDRLLATAKDLGASGFDSSYGWGRLDLARAVAGLGSPRPAAATPTTAKPAPTPTAPRTTATTGRRGSAVLAPSDATATTAVPETTNSIVSGQTDRGESSEGDAGLPGQQSAGGSNDDAEDDGTEGWPIVGALAVLAAGAGAGRALYRRRRGEMTR